MKQHPALRILVPILALACTLCLRADPTNAPAPFHPDSTNSPNLTPEGGTNAAATVAEALLPKHTNDLPKRLLSAEAAPRYFVRYIVPAASGCFLPMVRLGTNIVYNVVLVRVENTDLERLSKLGYQVGTEDLQILGPAR